MSKTEEATGLLKKLELLAKSSRHRGFCQQIESDGLSKEEQALAELFNEIAKNCQAASDYELTKYRLTNDALNIGHWDTKVVSDDPVDPHNIFLWSQKFRSMIGYTDERDFPNVASSWTDCLHPEDKERVLNALRAHIADTTGKTPYDLEYRLITKGGECRYFRAIGVTMRDEAGNPLRAAGALEDITERVRQQEMLENILDTMDSYIYVSELDTDDILFINKKMIEDYHLTSSVRGEKCWKLLQVGQTGRCEWCKKYELAKHPDKPVIWEEDGPITKSNLYNIDRVIEWPGGRKVHMQQSMDITKTKQAQKTLEQR